MRRFFEIGGFIAGAILVAFGAAVIVLGVNGRSTVTNSLKQEKITGTPDMTPALIKTAATEAGLKGVSLPSCSVAGKSIDTGSTARCFAQYMRIHALEASGGLTYAEMGRYATADGSPVGTNDTAKAVTKDGQPVANAARNTWVTETALTTALNVSYMAEQLSLFSIVIGVALVLAGLGFGILDFAALHQRRRTSAGAKSASPVQTAKPAVA
jgi:hypothetical protein